MARRRALLICLPILVGLLVAGAALRLLVGTAVERAERDMRKSLALGWAGTNEAHRIVGELPTREALEVLSNLLREPDHRRDVVRHWAQELLPPSAMKRLYPPRPAGPVQFCAYQWMAEALVRTNVAVEPLLPLLAEKPDLFWNIITGPMIAHLKAHQDDVRKVLPLLRHDDPKVVNAAAWLVAASDLAGVSEPEFRRLVAEAPTERLSTMAAGLVRVTRTPEATADWLWAEGGRVPAERGAALTETIRQLELRIRREAGFLRRRLDSTNAVVRLAGLRVAATHPARAAPVFDRIAELARSTNVEERAAATEACVLVAVSPKRELPMRVAAARIVASSGSPQAVRSLRRAAVGQTLPDEVEAALETVVQ